jgi:surface polysaccharide O-acyltransferase-like enzyme
VTSVGLIVVLFELTERVRESLAFQPLRWLGEASLFMYGAHLALINYVLAGQFPEQPLGMFLLVNAGATAALLLVGFGLRRLKEVWRSQPMLVRFLLGG